MSHYLQPGSFIAHSNVRTVDDDTYACDECGIEAELDELTTVLNAAGSVICVCPVCASKDLIVWEEAK